MESIKNSLIQVDKNIKSGEFVLAKGIFLELLNQIRPLSFYERVKERSLLLELAIFARRLSLFKEGISLLRPFVYPKGKKHTITLASEKVEYAALLFRLGLFAEGDQLIANIQTNEYSKVNLIRGFSHISRWNYEAAIQNLYSFSEQDNTSEYDKIVAKVNILFGYAFLENISSGESFSHDLLVKTSESHSSLLYANTLEAASEIQQLKKNFDLAMKYIKEAKQHMKDSGSVDYFLIEKQELILNCRSQGFTKHNTYKFEEFKIKAKQRKRFETIRELDFLKSTLTHDLELAQFVYAGTPYQGFKNKILKYFPELLNIQTHELDNDKKGYKKSYPKLNSKQRIELSKVQMRMSCLPFKLLVSMLDDYYLPKKIEDLFNCLYSEESFNYESAKDRVYQIIKRLRKEIRAFRLPLKVLMKDDTYCVILTARKPIALVKKIHKDYSESKRSSIEALLDKRRISIIDIKKMTSMEVAKKLGKSRRTAQRILRVL